MAFSKNQCFINESVLLKSGSYKFLMWFLLFALHSVVTYSKRKNFENKLKFVGIKFP